MDASNCPHGKTTLFCGICTPQLGQYAPLTTIDVSLQPQRPQLEDPDISILDPERDPEMVASASFDDQEMRRLADVVNIVLKMSLPERRIALMYLRERFGMGER